MNKIKKQREKFESRIEVLHVKIKDLQDTCPHADLTYRYEGSSDSYDRSQDDYWIEWHCEDCEKRWITSQDNSYHLTTIVYPHARDITREKRK